MSENNYPSSAASLFSSLARLDKKELFLYYWRACCPTLPEPIGEYCFDTHIGRKHRFDYAWLDEMVAVEINGNAWNVEGGGRHGKDTDLEKMNLAVSMGWRVYQFSPTMLNKDPDQCVSLVTRTLAPPLSRFPQQCACCDPVHTGDNPNCLIHNPPKNET